MDKVELKHKLTNVAFLLGLFLFSFLAYFIFKPLFGFVRNGVAAQSMGAILIAIIVAVGIILKINNKLSFQTAIALLFMVDFVIRLTYMLNTPFNCRQYDTVTTSNDGHQDYAWIIYTTNALPDNNAYQFYHPPLNAFIQSIFMHITAPILPLLDPNYGAADYVLKDSLYQTCQILSLLYMTITIYFGIKIINKFNLSKPAKLMGFAFAIFFPRLVQLSGQLNNDGLCIMFSIIAVYYTICWWRNKSFKNIIFIAIAEGLAMMCKLSGATICLVTAIVFIIEFIKDIMSKDGKKIGLICAEFVTFLIICGGLGLWFQVYAKIRFDQPFAYVFDNLNPALSTADHNFFERFINIFDFGELTGSMFAYAFDDYNIFAYTIKCSIFGEFSYWQGEGFGVLAVIMNYIFSIAFMVILIITLVFSKKEDSELKIIGGGILISQIVSFIYFNIKMPYGCTMDFRYIVPIIFGTALFIPYIYDYWKNKGNTKVLNFVVKPLILIEGIFLAASSCFYLTCI